MVKYELMTDSSGVSWSYVPETRFGQWFLRTNIWTVHVLRRAINDLDRILRNRQLSYPVIVDVGCGWGRSFSLLAEKFNPQKMIGIEIDPKMALASRSETRHFLPSVEIIECSNSKIFLPDDSVDIAFCHQTFHHLLDHESALKEYLRILKPGGILLFAESTKRYIHSYLVRYLFAHPMD
ncbi:MAG: class I SAM-dependent methyltransferase, partial [Rhodospirillaceae bacterium]